uniref:Uncharacterized protein n=1 Tax=Brassica campestris TaxID=3711 RepID=M4DLM4_BRACM
MFPDLLTSDPESDDILPVLRFLPSTSHLLRRFPSPSGVSDSQNATVRRTRHDYVAEHGLARVECGANANVREVKRFPQYFSFSLERKIKPIRRRLLKEHGILMPLSEMLKVSDGQFNNWRLAFLT